MRCKQLTFKQRVIALVLCIGALPFVFSARVYAEEAKSEVREVNGESIEAKGESKWLDDYRKPVGLTYKVEATLNAMYLWRGLCVGAMNIQPSASVGYGGLYLDMWWNVGATDWTFTHLLPEVDLSLGFSRWGVNVYLLYIHNFNCGFFDFNNYADRGNRLELNVRYTVSSKLPLSFLWATRVAAADGYLNEKGELVRAWSSYAEISYTQKFPYGLSLYGAVGITPWRSMYTGYQKSFAVQNIELRLRKDWDIHPRLGLMLQGVFCINPSALAGDRSTAEWHPTALDKQSVNANIAVGIYLK